VNSPAAAPDPSAPDADGPGPAALFFDGRSARGHAVRLALTEGHLLARPLDPTAVDAGPERRWPLAQVQWPERTRHGQRTLHLADGGSLQVADTAAFDTWRAQQGPGEGWVVRAQQNWRSTLVALVLLVAVGAAGYRWGVPAAARGLVALLPEAAEQAVGAQALQSVQGRWLRPTQLPTERQEALRKAFAQMVAAAWPAGARAGGLAGAAPAYTLRFHAATRDLGPNAFALPGGDIVVTDELVALLAGHDDTLLGVMAHELGHVQHRHGMHALVQFTLLSTATSIALGDFSSVLAVLPAWLAQMGYSRDAEREADAVAVRLLRASGRSPAAMVVLFERLAERPDAERGDDGPPIALASHPADEERKRYFRDAAGAAR
jgi:Zn-dependent protease with chaperone function